DVARRVAGENPHLYFEIQSLNEYGESALAGLRSAVERLSNAVASGNEAEFTSLMGRGTEYVREAGGGGGKREARNDRPRKSLGDSN
ncbi:MAG TPA: hypothetical protein VE110_07065, partial [Gemmatimonadaceae bacterium]|nr:hypothetical protein [Gemmatimonadaceae bacterium]